MTSMFPVAYFFSQLDVDLSRRVLIVLYYFLSQLCSQLTAGVHPRYVCVFKSIRPSGADVDNIC